MSKSLNKALSKSKPPTKEEKLKNDLSNMFPSLGDKDLQKMLDSYAPNGLLSTEEIKLDKLENDRAEAFKAAKLNKFKSLPVETRQLIVNEIELNRARLRIHDTNLDLSHELIQLRKRDNRMGKCEEDDMYQYNRNVISGLSNDSILEAHAETLLLKDGQ